MLRQISKPFDSEYPAYDRIYIDPLPDDGRLLSRLEENFETIKGMVVPLSDARLLYRYAEGKWTVKEILVHIVDVERIYNYRALCMARGEKTALPGFDQDSYVSTSRANEREVSNILAEYDAVRKSTVALFNGLAEDALMMEGVANGNRFTVRALAFHVLGHERHHMSIIREKYL